MPPAETWHYDEPHDTRTAATRPQTLVDHRQTLARPHDKLAETAQDFRQPWYTVGMTSKRRRKRSYQRELVRTPEEMEVLTRLAQQPKVAREEIWAARSPDGKFSREQLSVWGVPWPPPRGWIQAISRQGWRPKVRPEVESKPEAGPDPYADTMLAAAKALAVSAEKEHEAQLGRPKIFSSWLSSTLRAIAFVRGSDQPVTNEDIAVEIGRSIVTVDAMMFKIVKSGYVHLVSRERGLRYQNKPGTWQRTTWRRGTASDAQVAAAYEGELQERLAIAIANYRQDVENDQDDPTVSYLAKLMSIAPHHVFDKQVRLRTGSDDHLELGIPKTAKLRVPPPGPVISRQVDR
jgi:hypothetical protein